MVGLFLLTVVTTSILGVFFTLIGGTAPEGFSCELIPRRGVVLGADVGVVKSADEVVEGGRGFVVTGDEGVVIGEVGVVGGSVVGGGTVVVKGGAVVVGGRVVGGGVVVGGGLVVGGGIVVGATGCTGVRHKQISKKIATAKHEKCFHTTWGL